VALDWPNHSGLWVPPEIGQVDSLSVNFRKQRGLVDAKQGKIAEKITLDERRYRISPQYLLGCAPLVNLLQGDRLRYFVASIMRSHTFWYSLPP
jgi:hypothetical protein